MTKKFILALAFSAVAVTACGKKDGFKAAKLRDNKPAPQDNNEMAASDVEAKAEKIILADQLHSSNRSNFMSDSLKSEIQGISAKISVEGDKSIVEVSMLDNKSEACVESVQRAEIESKKMNELNRIDKLGRVTCIDTKCNNLLVLVETRTKIPGDSAVSSEIVDASVAVLMKKDESGVHQPLTTESKSFLQVNRTDIAVQSCLEIASRPQTGDELAVQREQERQEKLRQEEIAKRPQTGDEFAIQRLRDQQDARLKAIDARIAAIDARQKEIAASSQMTDEPKALATERSKLIQERDGILNARKAPAVDAEPVDPT